MSFSKAKLKRFNEIQVTNSPYPERVDTDQKESIRRLMKELSKDVQLKVATVKKPATPFTTTAEPLLSKTKNCTLRLFRAPSLPRRLRFNKHHSDQTPSDTKSLTKSLLSSGCTALQIHGRIKPKTTHDALDEVQYELRKKTQTIIAHEHQIEVLQSRLDEANRTNQAKIDNNEQHIKELQKELIDTNGGAEMLREISEKSISKIVMLETEIRNILRDHEFEMSEAVRTFADFEDDFHRLQGQHQILYDEMAERTRDMESLRNLIAISIDAKKGDEKKSVNRRDIVKENMKTNKNMNDPQANSQSVLNELEAIKFENEQMAITIADNEHRIFCISNEMAAKDRHIDTARIECAVQLKATVKKYDQQLATIKELNEMKIKEIESIFILERTKTASAHAAAEKRLRTQIEHGQEIATEKLRISEIENERRTQAMQLSLELSFEQEKQFWKSEMDKCQKIAETEIMQCEFERQDLQALLDAANELVKEKDEKIDEQQVRLCNEIAAYTRYRDEVTLELQQVRDKCERAQTEKYNYQQTLINTRSTVTILMERLTKSDADVEALKQQLEGVVRDASRQAEPLTRLQATQRDADKSSATAASSSVAGQSTEICVFEKQVSSEAETLDVINDIFNGQHIVCGKCSQQSDELKFDIRDNCIRDMKALLDEFAASIELARIELDTKDTQLNQLEAENHNLKVENMRYKFKCEQSGKNDVEQPYDETDNNFEELENETFRDADKLRNKHDVHKAQLAKYNRQMEIIFQKLDENVAAIASSEPKSNVAKSSRSKKMLQNKENQPLNAK